jgi:hypothetical protein
MFGPFLSWRTPPDCLYGTGPWVVTRAASSPKPDLTVSGNQLYCALQQRSDFSPGRRVAINDVATIIVS